jgi:ATP-dependent exoDNAse (exonuclease V) alpha subunit
MTLGTQPAHIDHGYAATVHKLQGVTMNRAHVLATPHMDRHAAYVGLTRHRNVPTEELEGYC